MYYDYDYVNGKRSDVVSAAVFSLLYAGAVPIKDAPGIVRALDALEFPHGIAACENKDYPYAYQWSYPNGWAPLHFLAIKGGQLRFPRGRPPHRVEIRRYGNP